MRHLQQLVEDLDTAALESQKIETLKNRFKNLPPEDSAWILFFLEGRKLKTKTGNRILKELVQSQTGLPEWMFLECNRHINDTAETLALFLPWSGRSCELALSTFVVQFLQPLAGFSQGAKRETIRCAWEMLSTTERVLYNKMLIGGFQLGIGKQLVHEALSQLAGIPRSAISRRLVEDWTPSATWFQNLISPNSYNDLNAALHPFRKLAEWESLSTSAEDAAKWFATWNFDGLRVQLTKHQRTVSIWTEQFEPVNTIFPELVHAVELLPSGSVLEGVIIGSKKGGSHSHNILASRLKRSHPTAKLIESHPIEFIATDIFERNGTYLGKNTFAQRRKELEQVIDEWSQQWNIHGNDFERKDINPDIFQQEMFDLATVMKTETTQIPPAPIRISEFLGWSHWASLTSKLKECPQKNANGLLMSHLEESLEFQDDKRSWWNLWKPAPMTAILILLSAQRGERNSKEFDQWTFGARKGEEWVTVAVAAGKILPDDKSALDAYIANNTLKKQGPLHLVKPQLIFKVGYEGVQKSGRSKSGIRLINARILEFLNATDIQKVATLKSIQANTLEEAKPD